MTHALTRTAPSYEKASPYTSPKIVPAPPDRALKPKPGSGRTYKAPPRKHPLYALVGEISMRWFDISTALARCDFFTSHCCVLFEKGGNDCVVSRSYDLIRSKEPL
jgi:hypothetical protein